MIKISKLADYATVIMQNLATKHVPTNSVLLSQELSLSRPIVAKLLKKLSQASFLSSKQGQKGGYILCKELKNITLLDIVEAIDGSIALTECVKDSSSCALQAKCSTKKHWLIINTTISNSLKSIKLNQLI
jgi:FeS assembly SUF system regulator